LWQFANRILACAGLPPLTKGVSARLAYAAATTLEGVHRLLPFFGDPPITRFVVRQLSTAHWFDLAAAKRDLGYAPKVSTDEGLRRVAEWFQRSQV
jgi:nucleoside-diphosphate-sugar epimerase